MLYRIRYMSNEKSIDVFLSFHICIPFNRHISNVFFLSSLEENHASLDKPQLGGRRGSLPFLFCPRLAFAAIINASSQEVFFPDRFAATGAGLSCRIF